LSASTGDDVELIVVDWDGGETLLNCLQSIETQTRRPSRLIIVDNGSRLPVYQRLPKNLLSIPYEILRGDTNLGFAGGINRGMEIVQAPFVGWIHNDAVLAEKWLERLFPALSSEGKIAGVQSIILRDKTNIDDAGINVENGIFLQVLRGQTLTNVRQVPQPWGISSKAALFRTNALRETAIGGDALRADLFGYYEDFELCARLRARGWKFKLVPEALTMHREPSSAGRHGRRGFRMRVRNRYVVARAHRGVGEVPALVAEDVTSAISLLVGGHIQFAIDRLRGALEGLTSKR